MSPLTLTKHSGFSLWVLRRGFTFSVMMLGWAGAAWAAASVGLVLCAEKVIKDVDNGGNVPLGLAVLILEGRVQSSWNNKSY